MSYSKESRRLARSIVVAYSRYDKSERSYSMESVYIPEFDVNALVAQMMKDNPSMANEANGVDNPSYESIMFPALLKSMSEISLENKLTFAAQWKKGIANYFENDMNELIEDVLADYNFEWRLIHAA